MSNLARRITFIENRRPARLVAGPTVALSEFDPRVAAMFLARGGDIGQMALPELYALEAELRRFAE